MFIWCRAAGKSGWKLQPQVTVLHYNEGLGLENGRVEVLLKQYDDTAGLFQSGSKLDPECPSVALQGGTARFNTGFTIPNCAGHNYTCHFVFQLYDSNEKLVCIHMP